MSSNVNSLCWLCNGSCHCYSIAYYKGSFNEHAKYHGLIFPLCILYETKSPLPLMTPLPSWWKIYSAILILAEVLEAKCHGCLTDTCHKGSFVLWQSWVADGWHSRCIITSLNPDGTLSRQAVMQLLAEYSLNDKFSSLKCSFFMLHCHLIQLNSLEVWHQWRVKNKALKRSWSKWIFITASNSSLF